MTTAKRTASPEKTAKPRQPKEKIQVITEAPETLEKHPFYGMRLDPEQKAFRDAIYNPEIQIVFCDSKAGTGKTTIAVATANLLVKYGFYSGLTFVIAPCEEGSLGFMPGDLSQKAGVYITPLCQALTECNEQPERAIIQNGAMGMKDGGWVEFMPHTYLRGSNLNDKVVILDEAQNYSFFDLKKTLTRISKTSKVIVIGHTGQRDAYKNGDSAFTRYIKHFEGDPRVAVCNLTVNYRGWLANHADELF